MIILNTRSAQALESAGIPRSAWNGINKQAAHFLRRCLMVSLAVIPANFYRVFPPLPNSARKFI